MNSNRREVLRLIFTCGLLLRSPFRLGSLSQLPTHDPSGEEVLRLLHLVKHRESASRIGTAYLQANPEMTTSGALTRSIGNKLHQRRWTSAGSLDESEMAGRLRETIREDFSKARTVSIGGWLLSETEVQLCGLYTVSTRARIL